MHSWPLARCVDVCLSSRPPGPAGRSWTGWSAATSRRSTWQSRTCDSTAHLQHQDREAVDVQDVLAVACDRFGLTDVDPERAAAWLRARYELRTRSMDLITDAYEYGN